MRVLLFKKIWTKIVTKILFSLLFTIALAPVVFAGEDIAKTKWIRVNSKNFNIVSNVGEKETKVLAVKLEQYRYVIASIFGVEKMKTIPVTVYVFKDSLSFTPFKVRYQGKVANISGYFVNAVDENLIALEIEGGDLRPIFHEYSHLVSSLTKHRLPLWLGEGLADFYSSFEIKKEKEAIFGYGIKEYIYLLRNKQFIPLEELFKVNFDSPYYDEKDKNNIFYAESWALVHYLSQGSRQKQYIQFVYSLLNGIDVDQAFNTAFNTDYATLEKELKIYISKNESPVAVYNFSSINFERDTTVEALQEVEVKNYLGKLLLNVGILVEAEQYFSDVTKVEPSNPLPYIGLGRLAVEDKNYSEGRKLLEKAILLGAKGGYVHYLYALAIYRDILGNEGFLVVSERNKLDEFTKVESVITRELSTAIELSPELYHPHYLLGVMSLVTEKNLKQGLESLTIARKLEPQNNGLTLLQAGILTKMKDYHAAKQLLSLLLSERTDKNVRLQAQTVIEQIKRIESSIQSVSGGVVGGTTKSISDAASDNIFLASNVSKLPKILSKTSPVYSDDARKEGIAGMVVLSVVFGKDGVIRDVKVIKGLGYGLDEEAIKAAQGIKFEPGKKDGQIVSVKARLEYTFTLISNLRLEFWQKEVVVKRGESKKISIKLNKDKTIKGVITVSLAEEISGIELVTKTLVTNEDDDLIEIKVSNEVHLGKYKLVFVARDENQRMSPRTELIVVVE